MAPARPQKIASSIRGELSRVIQMEMNDPRIGFITLTAVEVTPDLRVANVYISTMEAPERSHEMLAALDQARGFLRRRVADNLALRRTPELRFHLDASADRAERIDRLLDELHLAPEPEPQTDSGGDLGGGESDAAEPGSDDGTH